LERQRRGIFVEHIAYKPKSSIGAAYPFDVAPMELIGLGEMFYKDSAPAELKNDDSYKAEILPVVVLPGGRTLEIKTSSSPAVPFLLNADRFARSISRWAINPPGLIEAGTLIIIANTFVCRLTTISDYDLFGVLQR